MTSDEHKRAVEDAKDRLRSEIDIELRKFRRRFRVVGEAMIDKATADGEDFTPEEVADAALGHAYISVTGRNPRKALNAGS